MTIETPTILPTTVVGSHATPRWLWTAMAEIEKGNSVRMDTIALRDITQSARSVFQMDWV